MSIIPMQIFTSAALCGDLSLTQGVYYAFTTSDLVGQGIVVLLFAISIVVWTIMLEKFLALYRAKNLSDRFVRLFAQKRSVAGMIAEAEKDPSPIAQVYLAGVTQLAEFYDEAARSGQDVKSMRLSGEQLNAVETALEREVSTQILILEERIGLLATAVSVSPFFGLFGTVWGVMMAFVAAAMVGRADISALAPGVAGALLTTVVGLVVAIPSLIGYNILTNTIRRLTVTMDNFSEAFMADVRLEQLKINEE